jgi:hypothetical protein
VKQAIVTWFLVVVGWVVVHYLTVIRERQKDFAERVKTITATIYELEAEAIAFHESEIYDPSKGRRIVVSIDRIAKALSKPPLSKLLVSTAHTIALRRSITLRNFDKSGFTRQGEDSSIIAGIARACQRLIDAIDEGHTKRYLDAWWKVFRV